MTPRLLIPYLIKSTFMSNVGESGIKSDFRSQKMVGINEQLKTFDYFYVIK